MDLATRQIPDECSLAICILAVGGGGFGIQRVILALLLMLFSSLFMGMGDAKLFGALTLLLGTKCLYVFVLSFILAGACCLIGLISKRLKLDDSIAFAPYISIFALFFWIEKCASILNYPI